MIVNQEIKEGTIVKKAYEVDLSQIEDGYIYEEKIVHAKNRNQAKKMLLDVYKYDDLKLKNDLGNDLTDVNYLNIPVRRTKHYDIIFFEGREIRRYKYEIELQKRKRYNELDELLNDPKIKFCYIIKDGYYYRPNSCGYTSRKKDAGAYPIGEAVSIAKHCLEISLVPTTVSKHNKMIQDEIKDLESRLIKT